MTEQNTPTDDEQTTPPDDEHTPDGEQTPDDEQSDLQQTFGREYVEQLRTKSAGYRLRAKEAEQAVESLQRQLHHERVQALGIVVDAEQVPFDAEHLEDSDALQQAVEALLESKPYLRKRKAAGDIGQHSGGNDKTEFSLMEALRNNA